MKFISLNQNARAASFKEALFQGIADDKGLYVPEAIPRLSSTFLDQLDEQPLVTIGTTIAQVFIEEIPVPILETIIAKTFNFPLPLKKLTENLFLLELFHGPTLAFKDVGARFMAEVLAFFLEKEKKHITILVATSGDTGSAVAQGFYDVPNIEVYILYPAGRVSFLQEKQMTTLGKNIHPIAVAGTFDDCQQLVKQALADNEIRTQCNLTTANSINIGRLLPQIIYYFLAIAQLLKIDKSFVPTVVVPSGNFGNLTAAAYAKKLGAPINKLVAATNSNDIVPQYLKTGIYQAAASKSTLSNAMDVGNPNNFVRLLALFNNDYSQISHNIQGISISDPETLTEIKQTYKSSNYILDPHTAVGVAAAKRLSVPNGPPLLVVATAHPGKFSEVIEEALGINVPLPATLEKLMHKPTHSTPLEVDFQAWKNLLLRN